MNEGVQERERARTVSLETQVTLEQQLRQEQEKRIQKLKEKLDRRIERRRPLLEKAERKRQRLDLERDQQMYKLATSVPDTIYENKKGERLEAAWEEYGKLIEERKRFLTAKRRFAENSVLKAVLLKEHKARINKYKNIKDLSKKNAKGA